MAPVSEQMAMTQDQTMKDAIASIASLSNGTSSPAKRARGVHSPTRSIQSERRPSFSITLPPSCSRSSLMSTRFFLNQGEDSNRTLEHIERRPSVHFIPDEDDNLMNHEARHGLPRTPYPTTGEEEERIQSSLFKH
ncbi:hypothetical protein BC939DRAFT_445810 [Gamsiella multidivaricata]|uniref:uncharacterized protein n=1 Tax=Gamsiella multidivaricata TaxID=101098 RepID=UPI002220D7D0|nr:uncharacterized protein BC939DRAFT_445810 [Gamsiella multidivaricata]KAI7827116.1 hypothetical protein BC939DRAFT_445810 [Gamsiella multidivaricata]